MDRLQLPSSPSHIDAFSPDNGSTQGYLKGYTAAVSNSPSRHSRESARFVLSDTAGRVTNSYEPTRSSKSEVALLESQLENMTALKDQFAKKCRETESRLHELQANDQSRLLEGKLNALQNLLKERSADIDVNHDRAINAERRSDELQAAQTQQQLRIDELERVIIQRDAERSRLELELKSTKSTKIILETELTKQQEAASQLETLQHQQTLTNERNLSGLREDIRSKDMQLIHAGEVEVSLKKETLNLSNTIATLREELSSKDDTLAELGSKSATKQTEYDQLQIRTSKLDSLLEAQKDETERESAKVQQLTVQMTQQANEKTELLSTIQTLQSEISSLELHTNKLKTIEGCLARNKEDLKEETARHAATKRRVEELELRAENAAVIKNKVRDRDAEIQQLSNEVEAYHARVAKLDEELSLSKQETHAADVRSRQLDLELQHITSLNATMQSETAQLREEMSKINLLEGKIRGFESIIEAKDAELLQYTDDNARKASLIRELQLASSTNESLSEEVDCYRRDKKELEHRVIELDQLRRDAVAAAERDAAECESLSQLLKIKTAQQSDTDSELQALQIELTVMEQLRERILLLESDLSQRDEEVHRQQHELTTARSQLSNMASDADILREKCSELENMLTDKTNRINTLTEQLGTAQVTTELTTSDLQKARSDNKLLAADVANITKELNRRSDELRAAKESLHKEQFQNTELKEAIAAQTRNSSHQEAQSQSLQAQLRSGQERQAELESRLLSLDDMASRDQRQTSQISELEHELSIKNQQLHEKENEMVQLRINAKNMELQLGRSQQLANYTEDMKGQMADYITTIDRLESESRRKTEQLTAADQQTTTLQSKVKSLEKDLSASVAAANTMTQQLEVFEKQQTKYLETEGRAAGLEAGLTKKELEIREVLEQNDALSTKVKQLNEVILVKTAEVEKQSLQQVDIINKTETISHLESEISQLRSDVHNLRSNEDKASKKLSIVEEELQRSIQNAHTMELKLRDTDVESSAVIRELRNEVQIEENYKNNLQAELVTMKDKLQHEESQLQYQLQRCRDVEKESQEKSLKISRLEEENGRATVEWNSIVEQLKEEREVARNANKTIQSLHSEIESIKKADEQQRHNTSAHEQRLISELKVKTQQIDSLTDQVKETRHELCIARDQAMQQNKQLQAEQETAHRSSQQLKAKQQELDRNVRVLEDSRHRTDEWMRKLRETEEKLHESDRKKQEKDREITLLKNSVSDMQRKYDGAMSKLEATKQQSSFGQSVSSRELTETKAKLSRTEAELSRLQHNDESRWLRAELDQAKEKILTLQGQCNLRTHYAP